MNSLLGLAIGESSIAIAEASSSREQVTITRTATFRFPESLSLEQPTALGEALAGFLREHEFTAKRAAIGLPAKWLMAREKQVPPADAATASELLRLQAERQFSPELKELVFDYAGTVDAHQPTTVLLMATAQQNVERMKELAESAGLSAVAISASTLALSARLNREDANGVFLSLSADAAELAIYAAGSPRSLRHLPVTAQQLTSSNGTAAAGIALLGGELLKAASLGGDASRGKFQVWDGVGLDAVALASLEKRAGYSVDAARDVARLNVVAGGPSENSPGYGAAIALASLGMESGGLPVNFLRSRLTPIKASKLTRPAIWGIGVAAAALLTIIFMVVSQHQRQGEVDDMNARLKQMAPDIKEAEAMVGKANFANEWFDPRVGVLVKDAYTTRTPVLDCLKYLTEKFPQEGSVWATSFSFHENGKGVLGGRAPNQRDGLAVYTDILKDKHFMDVNLLEMRPAGSNTSDWAFSISFTFKGEPKP